MKHSTKLSLGLLSFSLIILLLSYLLYQIKDGSTAFYGDEYNGWLNPVMTRAISILMSYEFLKPHPLSVPAFILGFWLLLTSLIWFLSSLDSKLRLYPGLLIGKAKTLEDIVSAKKVISNVFISLSIASFALGLVATFIKGSQGILVATPFPLEKPELYRIPFEISYYYGVLYGVFGLSLRLARKVPFLDVLIFVPWLLLILWPLTYQLFSVFPDWLLFSVLQIISPRGIFGTLISAFLLPILALIYCSRFYYLQFKFRKNYGD